jgi:hypothetical protein
VIQLIVNEAAAARRRLPLYMQTAAGAPATGLTFVAGDLKLSKNGAAQANHAGAVAEVGLGLYHYECAAGEVDTVGYLSVIVTKGGAQTFHAMAQVIPVPASGGGGATATEIADAILTRDWTAVTGEAARSVLNALRFLRNHWSTEAGTLTVTKEDDATPAWTAELTTNPSADRIVAMDPS